MNDRRSTDLQFETPALALDLAVKSAGIGTWHLNPSAKTLSCSPECKAHFGYPADQDFTYQDWADAVYPKDRESWTRAVQEACGDAGTFELAYRTILPDRRLRWVLMRGDHTQINGQRVLTGFSCGADCVVRAAACSESERQFRATAARHESEERFRFTFEEAALGMAHVGLDGRWLRINRKLCEIVGYTREELLYMTFQDVTYPDDLEADMAHVKELLEGRVDRYSMEKRYIRKDGSLVWVNLTASLLRDSDGDPKYFISVVEDISARKQMEEALARSYSELESQVAQRTSALRSLSNRLMQLQDEERRRIARELHDSVGQYLTALAINLDLLARPYGQNRAGLIAESRQLLNHCLSETRTMSHLLHPPLLDETGFASAAQWYVEGFARRSGVEVELRLPPLERLPANIEIVLFRVLQETLNNIHRHSGSGKAEVRLDFDGKAVTLEVRDFGHGIQPERLERFRSSGTGVGVGLAGIRERVSELGGKMEIASDRKGTAVKVSVPAYGASAAFTPISAAS